MVLSSWRRGSILRPLGTVRCGYRKDTLRRFVFTPVVGRQPPEALNDAVRSFENVSVDQGDKVREWPEPRS